MSLLRLVIIDVPFLQRMLRFLFGFIIFRICRGVNLRGRIDKLRLMRRFRPEETGAYIDRALEDVRALEAAAAKKYEELRMYERMAKMAPTEDLYDLIRKKYLELLQDPDIKRHSEAVQVIEYVMGLTHKRPTALDAEHTGAENEGWLDIPEEVLAQRKSGHLLPPSTTLDFGSAAEHWAMHCLCDTLSWGDLPSHLPTDLDPSEEEYNERLIKHRLQAAADTLLSPLFAAVERDTLVYKTDFPDEVGVVNRGELIIVDGKTVREHMLEQYKNLARQKDARERERFCAEHPSFDVYYQKYVREASAQLVGSALAADRRVEVFVPDPDGSIPKTPMRMEREGHPQVELVAAGALKRFLSKLSFSKEAEIDEYEAQLEARERARKRYQKQCFFIAEYRAMEVMVHRECQRILDSLEDAVHQALALGEAVAQLAELVSTTASADAFFEQSLFSGDDTRLYDGGFKVKNCRSTAMAVGMLLMLGSADAEGEPTLTELMDPAQLCTQKRTCGSTAADILSQDPPDLHKLAEAVAHGLEALDKRIDLAVQGRDISKEEKLFSKDAAPLWFAVRARRSITQLCADNPAFRDGPLFDAAMERFADAPDKEARAKAWLEQQLSSAAQLDMYLQCAKECADARSALGHGTQPMDAEQMTRKLARIAQFESMRRLYAKRNDIDRIPYKHITSEEFACLRDEVFDNNTQLRRLAGQMELDQTVRRGVKTAAASGQFQRSLAFDVNYQDVRLRSPLIAQLPVLNEEPPVKDRTPEQAPPMRRR